MQKLHTIHTALIATLDQTCQELFDRIDKSTLPQEEKLQVWDKVCDLAGCALFYRGQNIPAHFDPYIWLEQHGL